MECGPCGFFGVELRRKLNRSPATAQTRNLIAGGELLIQGAERIPALQDFLASLRLRAFPGV